MYKKLIKVLLSFFMAFSIFTGVSISKVKANGPLKVFSLDIGRKYFNTAQIKQVINIISEKGFTHLHLLVGNDGLRFVLNDSSIEVDGIHYDSDSVKQAIHQGNIAYFTQKNVNDNDNNKELTESEMDDIFTYAQSKNIAIIPAVNSPGHMNAILSAMEHLGINNVRFLNSKTTLDFSNTTAVKFTQALSEKYMRYFSGKGVEIFNFGADEYANDLGGRGGFTGLKNAGKYGTLDGFLGYVNTMASKIKQHGMQPMVFNDGIYYAADNRWLRYQFNPVQPFDQDLIISYWIAGWNGYDVASAKTLKDKGHQMLNTNDAWYYVIGLNNESDSSRKNNPYHLEKALNKMNTVKFTEHSKKRNQENVETIGSMVAVWADFPGETYEYEKLAQLVTKYASANVELFDPNYVPPPVPDYMRVFSLDAGRKFFSKDSIKEIITRLSELKYTDLHLLFGNDGMRFLLDDLRLEVNGEIYEHDTVKNALIAGNNAYSASKRIPQNQDLYLTQADMDEILSFAHEKNIRIIPGLNSPGHMDAIVTAMENVGIANPKFSYNGATSKTTVSLENDQALNFTKALMQKYVTYFGTKKAQGVEIFNFGADEYGQDITYHRNHGASGFTVMQQLGLYNRFATYVNELAAMIKANGLKPMAFNDGFYHNQTIVPTPDFDRDIIISYWTSGFERYNILSAHALHEKGFKILNTNDAWYYVLGREYSGWYSLSNAKRFMQQENHQLERVTGDNTNVPIIGAMVAVWADEPSRNYQFRFLDELITTFNKSNKKFFIDRPKPTGKAVKVKYVDETQGVEIQNETMLVAENTAVGTTFEVVVPPIITTTAGLKYEVIQAHLPTLTGRVTTEEQVIVLPYQPKAGKAVKVRHVNQEGVEIREAEVIKQEGAQVGTRFEVAPKDEIIFEHIVYRNGTTSASSTGAVSEEEQVITFTYETVNGSAVVVKYMNLNTGTEIKDAHTIKEANTPVGTPFTVEVIDEIIDEDGLKYVLMRDVLPTLTGHVTTEEQVIVLPYQEKAGKAVKVRHVNQEGVEIAETETIAPDATQVGTRFEVAPKDEIIFEHIVYRNGTTSTSSTGAVSEEEQVITFTYETVNGSAVVVKYIDAQTNQTLKETLTLKQANTPVGTPFTVEIITELTKDDLVYQIKESTLPMLTGKVSEATQTIILQYEPKLGKQVKVVYENQKGQRLNEVIVVKDETQVGTMFNVVMDEVFLQDTLKYVQPVLKVGSLEGKVSSEETVIVVVYTEVIDKTALKNALEIISQVKESIKYVNATATIKQTFDEAINNAQLVFNNENATQQVIDQSLKQLNAAKEALDGVALQSQILQNGMDIVENVMFRKPLQLVVALLDANIVPAFKGKDVVLKDITFKTSQQQVDIGQGKYLVKLAKVKEKTVTNVYYVNDQLQLTALPFTTTDTHVIFETTHFSKYAIEYKKPIEKENKNIKNHVDTSEKTPVIYWMMGIIAILGIMWSRKKQD